MKTRGLFLLGIALLISPVRAQDETLPDSERIVFASNRDGNFEIYMIYSDGTGLTQLTDNETDDTVPEWSPDGTQIAFIAQTPQTTTRLLTILNLSDASIIVLDDTNRTAVSWSPDGSQLAYTAQATSVEIFVSTVDGADARQLTHNRYIEGVPAWNPVSGLLVFTSDRGGNGSWNDHTDIYTLNLDDDEVIRLTNTAEREFNPVWSPDGTQIAFTYYFDDNRDIYVMDADGSNLTRLTTDPAQDSYPSWSPDGTRIVFQSDRFGNDALFILDLEDGSEGLLTDHFADERYPAWSPAPVADDSEPESS